MERIELINKAIDSFNSIAAELAYGLEEISREEERMIIGGIDAVKRVFLFAMDEGLVDKIRKATNSYEKKEVIETLRKKLLKHLGGN